MAFKSGSSRCILEEPVNWADGFVVVYNIADRLSFLNAKSIPLQIKGSCEGPTKEVSAAEEYSEVSNLFTKVICHVMENLKHRADRRQYSGSKSIDKAINNVFGKRRKSV
ncbi:RERG/RAS-like b [Epinephelus lanceolatus]